MPSLTVKLPAKLKAIVDERLASGEYRQPDEYVGDLVRKDHERRQTRALEALLLRRLDRTNAVDMDAADFKRIRRRFLQRVSRSKDRCRPEVLRRI
jgi:Arc/MetJ-type ribon-helix-helix transcriptional regulator